MAAGETLALFLRIPETHSSKISS